MLYRAALEEIKDAKAFTYYNTGEHRTSYRPDQPVEFVRNRKDSQ